MDKILNKIIRQVIAEATTVKRLTNQVDSDTILNKLIKQVITEQAQKTVISKLDNKVIALTSKYGFGFKISANYPISLDQVRGKIQINSQYGTSSPYNSYLNYTYFVGSNMHKNPDKKFVANVIIVDAVTMKSFNSARFNAEVKYLLEPDDSDADVVIDGYRANTVGRKDGDLEIKHHKERGTAEAVYNSNDGNYNRGSNIIFIDKEPDYATLPADLMTVLTKKGAALMSTDDDKKDDGKNLASKNSNATTYFNSGVVKLRSNDDAGAIADFDAAIKIDPKYVAAYENRGNVKANLKDYAGAIADFDEAIKLDPNNKYLYSARSNAKNNETPGSGNEDLKTYDILNKGGKLPDANTTPVVDKPVVDKPVGDKKIEGRDLYFDLGTTKLQAKDDAGAIEAFDKAIKLDSKYATAYYKRGLAKANLEKHKDAIKDFDKAIELNSTDANAYYNRARAKIELADNAGAIVDFTKAIELDTKYTAAYVSRGVLKRDLKDYAGAIADYDKAIEVHLDRGGDVLNLHGVYNERGATKNLLAKGSGDEDIKTAADMKNNDNSGEAKTINVDATTYFKSGSDKYNLKDYKGAIQDYDKAIELDSKYAEAYYERGRCKHWSGDKKGAILDLEKAEDLDPKLSFKIKKEKEAFEVKDSEELRKQRKIDSDAEIVEIDKAIKLDPKNAENYYKKAVARYGYDNSDMRSEDQLADLNTAIELDPTYKDAYVARAYIKEYDLKDYAGAIADISEVIKLDPENGVFWQDSGRMKIELKDYAGAIADYTKAIELFMPKGRYVDAAESYRQRGKAKNLLEPGSGDEDIKTADMKLDPSLAIKKQTFKYGTRDNADLKTLQDEIKAQLKASDQTYITSVPALKAFMNVANMTGYYGTITSNLIADLKKAYAYKNFTGGIIEPDFLEILIGKMKSKLKLTEQFNFTDTEKKLISNKTVVLNPKPVNTSIKKDNTKKDTTKKDDPLNGDRKEVALTKAYQICLDAAKYLKKITTTQPHDHWSKYLRWDGASYRPNANKKGIAWFNSSWEKYYGTKLAAAAKIRNTVTQKNINELNRRKNDIIEMIRKGGSMTVYLRIQNPFTGAPTDFKIKWDYFAGIQNAAVKGNPKPAAKKSSYDNSKKYGGNLGR